ncbi:MAG: hypothetical protein A2521_10380 [Deltaproteobacteria bacterium RIFOXYD12_FULL_57_12]|nr:MAG: hypothetical protein A2521_10380 [Deltaproteobacteria bacterium RIFOXYD12_FULL_57_12]
MAEIKSTLEKAMERLARMGEVSSQEIAEEESLKRGMRLAAEYLSKSRATLAEALVGQGPAEQRQLRKGMVQTLLRNIVLPRDEVNQAATMAMAGLMELAGAAGDMATIFGEMQQILERYVGQRTELRRQLEGALRQQLEMAMARQPGGQADPGVKIDPTRHPRFAEEWQRIQSDLTDQYSRALNQYKELITQRLA